MRNTLILLFVLFSALVSAQEVVLGLNNNPQLKKSISHPQAIDILGTKHLYIYKQAKTTLPFVDDFSANRIKTYTKDTTSPLFSSTEHYYLFEVNSQHPDTVKYSTDTTYHYTLGKADSAANPTFDIYKYDFAIYPPVIYDTIKGVFPAYSVVDQSMANPDTSFLNAAYVVNVLYLAHLFNDDNSLWTGRGVYENSNYPINPPTIGVATFDALDENGELYLGSSAIARVCDSLVSKPIDLSTLLAVDSLYLSFFVENKGFGDAPEAKDTMVLQFYNAAHNWVNVWTSAEQSSWPTDTFLQFIVPLNSSLFFHDSFKFRFYSYASVSGYSGDLGNRDHWHLDYVVLDKNRTQDDDYISDVAFKYPPSTLINGYYNVPWPHFKSASNLMLPSSRAEVSNISNAAASVNFAVDIKEDISSVYASGSAQNFSIGANSSHQFIENYGSFAYASAENDTAIFDVRYALNTSLNGNNTQNDTAYSKQHFSNFYAYDNSTAEAGYGFYDAGAEFAYQFAVLENKGDTIRGLCIYFNDVINHSNYLTPFTFRIRKDNAGLPGTIVWESATMYADSSKGLNKFLFYEFDEPQFLKGVFYIGFHQTTSEYLNVGLDLNTVSTNKMFYKTINGFTGSAVKGSVMLHPVFGKKVVLPQKVDEKENMKIALYPNPASSYFYLESASDFNLTILDIQGKELQSQHCTQGRNTIAADSLPTGVYVVKMLNASTQEIQYQKLVLQ